MRQADQETAEEGGVAEGGVAEGGYEAAPGEAEAVEAQKERMPHFCPVAVALTLLEGKWTLHVVHALLPGKKRFNEIGHALGGVNPRTLRERLRALEAEGILTRTVRSSIPPWVEYELTEKGRDLQPIMDAMAGWSRRYLSEGAEGAEGNG